MAISDQFQKMRRNECIFAVIHEKAKENPKSYWNMMAYEAPELPETSQDVLNLTPTESPSERSFSSQKIVHRPSRASLAHENADSEVFLRWNLRSYLRSELLNDKVAGKNTAGKLKLKPTKPNKTRRIVNL